MRSASLAIAAPDKWVWSLAWTPPREPIVSAKLVLDRSSYLRRVISRGGLTKVAAPYSPRRSSSDEGRDAVFPAEVFL